MVLYRPTGIRALHHGQIKALLWLSTLLGEKHYDVSSKKFESERNAIV